MMKRDGGFSLLELLMVMLIMGFVLAATSEMFISMLRGFRQQSKIAETNIEGIIGLELLRRDLESAGYGLPWTIPVGTVYGEVAAGNATAAVYNDTPSNAPRAFLAGNNIPDTGYMNGSDYLVVKAVSVARNNACTKWNYLSGGAAPTPWVPAGENLGANDRVIVVDPGSPEMSSRTLISPTGDMTGGAASLYSGVSTFSVTNASRLVYGVDPDTDIRTPFNRADYYVGTPDSANMPKRCAPGTGILYKAVLSQGTTGTLGIPMPLLDCVADMQVVTYLDTTVPSDGEADTFNNGYFAADALTVRDQVKEIRVFILAHEGQRDTNYTHPTNPILVGQDTTYGRSYNMVDHSITNWQNYRWKVYTLVVKPNNLR